MRKILLIDGGKVTPLNETKFTEEGKLQDYLEKYPNLIPLSDIVEGASDLVCIGREVGAGSGAIDLLCVDKDGLLTIIETKLRRNRELRREVIGQIIEYAAYVSQWAADDVYRVASEYFSKSDKVPAEYKGKTLDEGMKQIVGEEFSDEDFRSSIGQNLREGRIRLIIAVDELIEPLRATVTFLNSQSNFDILLLEVSDFEESETKRVLVPLLFGYAQTRETSKVKPPKINEEIFLDRCRAEGHEKAVELYSRVKALRESRRASGDFINWGVSGYSYRIPWRDYPLGETLFVGRADGSIELWMWIIEKSCEAGQGYLENLRKIADFGNKVDDYRRHKAPSFSTDEMTSSDIGAFISAIKELAESLPQN
jgi:hypothetical protein